MKKRSLFIILTIIISVCLSLALISCDGDQTTDEIEKYALSYEAGNPDAVGTAINESYAGGAAVTAAENPFTLTGYAFTGWEGGGKVYQAGEEFKMPESSLTLTAKWSAIIYSVEYVLGGGTNAADSLTEYTVDKKFTLPVPQKENFVFMGWYESQDFSGQAVYEIAKGSTGQKKLYAKWAESVPENVIVYILNDGTNNPNNPSTYPDEGFTLLNPERQGYEFSGWYDNATFDGNAVTAIAEGSSGEKTFYAKWIKLVTVSFDSNGGNEATPKIVREGESLLLSELPEVRKDGLVFEGWYLDEQLETKLSYGGYQFDKDTVLYAKFSEITRETLTVEDSKEATLTAQPSNVIFSVSSSVNLTNENLSEYVTLTRGNSRFELPELTVEKDLEGTDLYKIIPSTQYTAGGNYVITVKDPLTVNVTIDEEIKHRQKVHFMIADQIKSVTEYQPFIIPIEPTDYYLFGDGFVNLSEECVLNKNILSGVIVSINKAGVTEHYKIENLVMKTENSLSYYHATLGECSLYEVYSKLDIYSGRTENDVCEESAELKSEQALRNTIEKNPEYKMFSEYILAAVTEYGVRNNIVSLSDAKPVAEDSYKANFIKYKTNEDPEKYADVWHTKASIEIYKTIKLSSTVSAQVTFKIIDTLSTATTVQGYLYADGFFLWEIIENIDYDFYLYTIFRNETDIELKISLTSGGKTHEITDDVSKIINTADPDSVVAKYREYFDMKTDEFTLLTIPLFRLSFNIKIFEFGFPVELRAKMDVNSIFKGKINAVIQRGYSISGTDEDGLSWNKYDHQQYFELDFKSIGSIGLKAGISVGMEVSFTGLSSLGRIGMELEIGAYFNYYGYGNHRIVEMTISGTKFDTTYEGNANFYYDFGIYLAVNAYVRSDIFSFDYTKNFLYKEFPLFDGGTRYVVLGFAPTQSELTVNTPFINVVDDGLLKFDVLDLKTGERSVEPVTKAQLDKAGISGAYYGEFDKTTGKFDFLGLRSPDYRQDLDYTIEYWGKHGNWNSFSLYKEIHVTYLPPDLGIDPEDANKMCNVSFTLNGEEIYSTKVLIAKTITSESLSEANAAAVLKDPLILYIGWANKANGESVYNFVTDDCEMEAKTIVYQKGTAFFTYLGKREDGSVYTRMRQISAKVGTNTADLVSELEDFNGHIDEDYYRFTGWDKEFEALPPSRYYDGGRDLYYVALYEKIPFEVAIKIDPIKDYNDKVIQDPVCIYFTATYNDVLNYASAVSYHYGYSFVLRDGDGNDPTMKGVTGPTTLYGSYSAKNNLSVSVMDSNMVDSNEVKRFDGFSYGQDASSILNDPDVIAFAETLNKTVMDETLGWNVTSTFKGWSGANNLQYLTRNVELAPLIETKVDYVYLNVKFDAKGGTLPSYMHYQAVDIGFEYLRGSNIYDLVSSEDLIPEKASSGDYDYVFMGWYDNSELTGVPVGENYVLTENLTLYAAYAPRDKIYKLTVLSDGEVYLSGDEPGKINYEENSGHFSDDSDEIVEENLSKEQLNDKLDYYFGDTFSKPISDDATYEFSSWIVMDFGSEIKLYPIYIPGATSVLITFDLGEGYPIAERKVISANEFQGNNSATLYVNNFFTPKLTNTNDYLNSTTETENFGYAYEDENYYYFPMAPICWSEDGITPLPEDKTYDINATSDDIDLYALYTKKPKIKKAEFIIDKSAKEAFTVEWDYYNMFLRGEYGTEIDPSSIPEAKKDAEQYSVYEYVFEGWKCVETNEPTVYDFDKDYSYTPVFTKQLRKVIITLDATVDGLFESNGKQFRTVETVAGASVTYEQLGETPVYIDEIGLIYFDWYFDGWDHVDGFTVTEDSTFEAKYVRVRNQVSAPKTGVTISNGSFSEDICYNTIPGYEYHPDVKVLYVNEPGLTVSNSPENTEFNDLSIWLTTYDVTLCDLKLEGAVCSLVVTYYINGSESDDLDETIPGIATVKIKGTVEMKLTDTEDTTEIISAQSGMILRGVGENPTLTLSAITPNLDENYGYNCIIDLNSSWTSGNISGKIVDLTVNINVDTESDYAVSAIYVNSAALEIENSEINVDFTSNTTAKYVIKINPALSSVENPENAESYAYLEEYFNYDEGITWLCPSDFPE